MCDFNMKEEYCILKEQRKKNLKTHEFVVGMLFPFSSIKWNCILYVQFNWDFQRKNGFSSIFVIFLWDLWLIQLFLEIFLVYFFSSKFIQTRPNLFQMIKIIFFKSTRLVHGRSRDCAFFFCLLKSAMHKYIIFKAK